MNKFMFQFFGVEFHPFEVIVVPLLFTFTYFHITLSNQTKIKVRGKGYIDLFILVVCLFMLSVVLSYSYALNQKMVSKSLLKWIEIFGLAGIVFLFCSTPKRFKHLWWLLVSVYMLNTIVSLVNVGLRVDSYAYALARLLPSYSALFLVSLGLAFVRKPLVFIALVILSLLVALSLTRGAWIGLAGVIGYFTWRSSKKCLATVIIIVTIGLLLSVILISPSVRNSLSHKITAGFSLDSASNRQRLGTAVLSLNAFCKRPFTGIGAENFSTYLVSRGIPKFVHTQKPEKLTPHNFFLQTAAENGIVGLLSVVGILLILYRILFSSPAISKVGPYMQGLKFYYIALLVSLMFGYVAGGARLTLGLYMGLVLACLRIRTLGRTNLVRGEL